MNDYRFVGEPIPGPGAALRRWADDRGRSGWALVFPDPWTRHPLLVEGVGEVRAFLEAPGDDAIAPLVGFQAGVLRYAADGALAAQLLDGTPSPRAGLELLAAVARALARALEASDPAGIPSHGALDPWRIAVGSDGSVRLLGLGVPPVEALAFLDEEVDAASADSLRFFPPERLEDRGEDGRSDLFSLGLIAAELIAGKPVLDGGLNAVLDAIYDARVSDRIDALLPGQPDAVVELLCAATEHRIQDRPRDLNALADEATALSRAAAGPALSELAERASAPPAPEEAPPPTQLVDFHVRELIDKPSDAATEVVDLAVLGSLARESDTLLAARGLEPLPPDPGLGEDPETTELGPLGTDEAPLPPPVSDLPEGADLERVRAHAQACVTRADLLAALARRGLDAIRSAPGTTAADRAEAEAEADRAIKAATTARSSAGLLALDDDVAGARITLDLVTRAEQQAESAALQVQAAAAEIMRRGRAARAAEEARARAEGQAEEHTEAAYAAAEAADAAARELDGEREQGLLTDPEAIGALARVWKACERADEAAGAAEGALAAIRTGESPTAALEQARAARSDAEESRSQVLALVAEARALERQGAEQIAAEVRAEAERARDGERAAAAAAERARSAAGLVPDDVEAQKCGFDAGAEADRARSAAERASATAAVASASARSADGREALIGARAAADEAAAAATTARSHAERAARRAGAAAEAAARLAALRERAGEAVDKLQRRLDRYVQALAEAQQALAGVRSPAARQALDQGREELDEALRRLPEIRRATERVSDESDLEALEARARDIASGSDPRTRVDAARRAAADELAARKAEEEREEALASARTAAREHAERCRTIVDAAATRLRTRIVALQQAGLPDVVERCGRALEILDIAEFQAGEAAQSAEWANAETDPDEARAHADTAASFASRIELDLPEADALVEEAEAQAAEVQAALDAARNTATSLMAEATRDLTAIEDRAAAVLRDAAGVRDDSIARARELLEDALAELRTGHSGALSASQRAMSATSRAEAEARVEELRQTTGRLGGLEANARDRTDALARVAAAAIEAARAVEASLGQARAWAEQAAAARSRADEHLAAAHADVERHGAIGDPAREALREVEQASREAAAAATAASTAARNAAAATDPEAAGEAAAVAEAALGRAEQARDAAEEAARSASEAAAAESREREATRKRRLEAAREVARTHATRARDVLDRVRETSQAVAAELARVRSTVAQAEAQGARAATQLCEEATAEAIAAHEAAAATEDPTDAEGQARIAEGAASRAQTVAGKAEAALQRARDRAREAAAEADALARVAEEAGETVSRAEEALERAKEEARRILDLKMGLEAKKSLAARVRDELQSAERAVAKVAMTAPMAAEAADLGTAQALLATCRATVGRAEAQADAVRELVAEAARAVAEEAERRSKALAEARHSAREPSERAREAAAAASGWLESARRNADSLHTAQTDLAALARAADRLAAMAQEATRVGEPLDGLDDTAAIHRTGAAIATAAGGVAELLDQARGLHASIAGAVKAERQRQEAVKAALVQARQARDQTAEIAVQARATLEELEAWLGSYDDPGSVARQMLDRASIGAQAVRDALGAIEQVITEPPTSPAAIGGSTAMQMEQALKGLEAVIAADASCREAAVAFQRERAATVRREDEERRRAAEAAAKAQQTRAKKKSDDREAKRHARLEERRRRFMERRGIASEDEASQDDTATPAGAPENEAPERKVRRWERGKTNATEGSTRPRRRPRPSRAPPADPAPEDKGGAADALLQRLRDRQRRGGDD